MQLLSVFFAVRGTLLWWVLDILRSISMHLHILLCYWFIRNEIQKHTGQLSTGIAYHYKQNTVISKFFCYFCYGWKKKKKKNTCKRFPKIQYPCLSNVTRTSLQNGHTSYLNSSMLIFRTYCVAVLAVYDDLDLCFLRTEQSLKAKTTTTKLCSLEDSRGYSLWWLHLAE